MNLYLGADSSVEVTPLPTDKKSSSSSKMFKKTLNKTIVHKTKISNNKDDIVLSNIIAYTRLKLRYMTLYLDLAKILKRIYLYAF